MSEWNNDPAKQETPQGYDPYNQYGAQENNPYPTNSQQGYDQTRQSAGQPYDQSQQQSYSQPSSYNQGYTGYGQPSYDQGQPSYDPYNQQTGYNNQNGYNPYPQGYPSQTNSPYGYDPYHQPGQPAQPPKKKKGAGVKVLVIVLVCAILFGSLGYGFNSFLNYMRGRVASNAVPSENSVITNESQVSSQLNNDYDMSSAIAARNEAFANSTLSLSLSDGTEPYMSNTEVVKKVADSVVEITTEYVTTSYSLQQYISSGAGSGVIITSDGYIVTNNHVIDKATKITVTLRNGETYPAVLVGLDEDLDVALIKINAINLTVATIGTSADLLVGESILAMGNPLGQLGGSVSSGIISALGRSITVEGKTMDLLQIDASINPGNSGGALFDQQGTLVGIVNAKSTGEDVEGIGFAIPIDNVIPILSDLQEYGYVKGKVYLGITMVDINNDQLAWMYRVSELGVYIYSVNAGSAAESAGLSVGDRIISIDGTTISSSSDVQRIIQSHKIGDVLSFVVYRSGSQRTISVTVGEYIPSGILNNQTLQ